MLKNLKSWLKSLDKSYQKLSFGSRSFFCFLAVAIICSLFACNTSRNEQSSQKEQAEVGSTAPSKLMTKGFSLCYVDTVLAVAVHDLSIYQDTFSYRDVVFSHNLHMRYKFNLKADASDLANYNHPLYVETGDLCVVLVEIEDGNNRVSLVENLTKREIAELEIYWDYNLINYD